MSFYPNGMRLQPLTTWPGQLPEDHVRSSFSAPLTTTLDELDRELRHLGVDGENAPSVLEIALRDQDFRNDGMPRANARPSHPGVVLHIESRFGTLSYPAAKFITWTDNLRAITLGLDGLRRLDRYGITPGSEQYQGWKQLPPTSGGNRAPQPMSVDEAERFLRTAAVDVDPSASLSRVFRTARALAHPDRNNDSRVLWDAVEAAGDVLRRAGRLT